jgi:hypothetical protein
LVQHVTFFDSIEIQPRGLEDACEVIVSQSLEQRQAQ